MKSYRHNHWFGATLLIVMLLIGTMGNLGVFAETADKDTKNILIINSYEPDNPWTQTEEAGISAGLESTSVDVRIFHEYMDSKYPHGADFDDVFSQYLVKKYKNVKIDIVVSTDDYATQFVRIHRDDFLDKKIPVVFSGVNDLSFNEPNFVGVYESVDIKGTVNLIKSVHGETTPIMIVTDKGISSESIIKSTVDDQAWLRQNQIQVLVENDVVKVRQKLTNFRDGVVIFLLFNQDSQSNNYSYYDGLDLIRSFTDLPIYSVWDFYIGHGIVGGSLITEKEMGESVSDLIRRLLGGEDYSVLKNATTKAKNLYDYPMMTHYGIEKKQVADQATIVNVPVTFWGEYYQLMMLFIGLSAIFVIIILLLIHNIRQKNDFYRMVGEHKNEILQTNQKLEKRIADNQVKMIELSNRNKELVEMILQLKKKVGFSERLPFVLHEINSMLSVIHSRISFLQSQAERIERNEANLGGESQFEEMRELLNEALINCEMNMESTVQLVGATKTCYSDLAISDSRNYKLSGFVEAFWQMIKPTLKKKKVSFTAKIPEEVGIYGNPGDFLTILAILFGNSLRHGYPMHPERGLKIEFEGYMSQHSIHMIYRDDGDGCLTEKLESALNTPIEEAIINKGGIGLYQLNAIVTETMKGQIMISGDINEGIQVRINIPKAGEHNEK